LSLLSLWSLLSLLSLWSLLLLGVVPGKCRGELVE